MRRSDLRRLRLGGCDGIWDERYSICGNRKPTIRSESIMVFGVWDRLGGLGWDRRAQDMMVQAQVSLRVRALQWQETHGCRGPGAGGRAVQYSRSNSRLVTPLIKPHAKLGRTLRRQRRDYCTVLYDTVRRPRKCAVQAPAPVRSSSFPFIQDEEARTTTVRTTASRGHRAGYPTPRTRTPAPPHLAPHHSLLVGLATTTAMTLQVEVLGVRPTPHGRS